MGDSHLLSSLGPLAACGMLGNRVGRIWNLTGRLCTKRHCDFKDTFLCVCVFGLCFVYGVCVVCAHTFTYAPVCGGRMLMLDSSDCYSLLCFF